MMRLARYSQSGNRAYLTDALGSVIAETNDQQEVATTYSYSRYGQTSTQGEKSTNANQYTARENDDTGLYFYRARYYDPVLKRFISEDPIGLKGGLNLYAYVRGNPINLTDPYGNDPIPDCVKTMLDFWYDREHMDRIDIDSKGERYVPEVADAFTPNVDEINIKPNGYDPHSAEGIALIGHEVYHTEQHRDVTLFGPRYLMDGAKNGFGRENKYEKPAYQRQQEIYETLKELYGDNPCPKVCKK